MFTNRNVVYHETDMEPLFDVDKIYTVHYYEHFHDYPFGGEKHDFWEILYLDTGKLVATDELYDTPFYMHQGDLLLLPPNTFHNFECYKTVELNLFVISFSCKDPLMETFVKCPLQQTSLAHRAIIAKIISEARSSFTLSLSEIREVQAIELKENAVFGCIKMIRCYLEQLLILLYRSGCSELRAACDTSSAAERKEEFVSDVILFLKENLYEHITMEDVCRQGGFSVSQLQKKFKSTTGLTVMSYLSELRIEEAKYLIRQKKHNFTEIAEMLCFASVHHFSRRFKNFTALSPTEYAKSLGAVIPSLAEPAASGWERRT